MFGHDFHLYYCECFKNRFRVMGYNCLHVTSMVLWIRSSSVHWYNTTWHIGVLYPAGGIQRRQLSVKQRHSRVFCLTITATVALSVLVLQKWSNLKENCPVYHPRKNFHALWYIHRVRYCHRRWVLTSSGNFLAAPMLQSADQIFFCALATGTPAWMETEKLQFTGLELRIPPSTDSDY